LVLTVVKCRPASYIAQVISHRTLNYRLRSLLGNSFELTDVSPLSHQIATLSAPLKCDGRAITGLAPRRHWGEG